MDAAEAISNTHEWFEVDSDGRRQMRTSWPSGSAMAWITQQPGGLITAASVLCDTAPVPIRAVVFDLFITLTDWEAERCRPRYMDELAVALGADPLAFSSLMRATFTERVAGDLGDARSTFSTLAARLGCDLSKGGPRVTAHFGSRRP